MVAIATILNIQSEFPYDTKKTTLAGDCITSFSFNSSELSKKLHIKVDIWSCQDDCHGNRNRTSYDSFGVVNSSNPHAKFELYLSTGFTEII